MTIAAPARRPQTRAEAKASGPRFASVDALRGLAIVGMLLVDNRGSAAMPSQFVHVQWNGLRVADVVFPLFLFAVGVSMVLSRRTSSPGAVAKRVVALVLLGSALVDARYHVLHLTTGVLQHIAAAYGLCWLVLKLPRRWQAPAVVGVLAAVWAVYAFVPAPGVVPGSWAYGHTIAEWFEAHVLRVDFSAEGVHSYLPSIASVFAGVLAGRYLVERGERRARRALAGLAVGCAALGTALMPVMPLNKRLWTPSYALLTAGIAAALLLLLHVLLDGRVRSRLRWTITRAAAPLRTLGRNAIVVFAFSELVFRAGLSFVQGRVVSAMSPLTAPGAAVAYALLSVVAAWALSVYLERRNVRIRI
jgi:predicted acyltransferase